MAMEFTTANFEQEVLNSEVPVLVDFWATWCMPCKMLAPVIEELAEEANGAYKVSAWKKKRYSLPEATPLCLIWNSKTILSSLWMDFSWPLGLLTARISPGNWDFSWKIIIF